ncbi:disrupted in schizophrenia 1 protein [Neolamprologus brichardi]|uniref:disrupted in schizophrenia 1 protein n=1 Tax=Neolamprologus brichardi TaxID=32507 RepID=UPI001643D724|nr:disrupted in schizophrenia 1 protein [Neolamprologus brichardi]
MFAGLMGLECHGNSLLHRRETIQGGRASGTAGSSSRKRLHRRPGYMRGEQCRLQSATQEEEEDVGTTTFITNGKSGRDADIADATNAQRPSPAPADSVSLINHQQPDKHTCSSWKTQSFVCSVTHPPSPVDCNSKSTSSHLGQSSLPHNELRLSSSLDTHSEPEDSFNSSFSFIQQSLTSSQKTTATPTREQELSSLTKAYDLPQTKPETLPVEHNFSKQSSPAQTLPGGKFWRECLFATHVERSHVPDCEAQSIDIEATSSLSLDSDSTSASSVTSGYESATPALEQGWDNLLKKYEGVLQDCLQNNRTHTKIESMMLKLQRLQQKAILDDDYDAAERFGKKLEELSKERSTLELGLPSQQPSVALLLERLRQAVDSALQRADCSQHRECAEPVAGEQSDSSQGPLQRRERLIRERRLVEEEIAELQQRLVELKDRSRCLEQQIQQEEQQVEAEELEASVLRSCSTAQLRDMSRTLQDLVASENRTQISVSRPPSMLRLQEQEQALNLSIKEATAKVVMSQRLGSSLRRKVSETETQLLALHEAKLAAISGNDFSSAKELKAEMKAVYLERDRLEALAKRLHSLSSGSSQELARMKEQRQQLRQELEQREAQHGESQRLPSMTNNIKPLSLLFYGSPNLERIWEADLEACHLFLRGLQLRTPSCSGADIEDLPTATVYPPSQPGTKEEEDCAMLTALGGRWCPEANLQNSEFTKDGCSDTGATELTERCEQISNRLLSLEDELQMAILNRDQGVYGQPRRLGLKKMKTRVGKILSVFVSLEKEVQEVKSTLQTMLAQLKVEDEDEEEVNELDDLMTNGIEEEEEEEEEEDQYFSDSWDI